MIAFLKNLTSRFSVKTPVLLQQSETECGVVALAIMLSYYKTHVPVDVLRTQCGTSRDGCKATTLMKVANEYGYQADAYRIEMDQLHCIDYPVIAFWNFNHYIVINGIGKDKVYINDPAHGPAAISMAEFDAAFTGVILVITPTEHAVQLKSKAVLLPLLLGWAVRYRKEFAYIVMGLCLTILCPLLNSGLSKIFFDYCIVAANQAWLPSLGCISLAIAIIYGIVTVKHKWSIFKLCAKASILHSALLILHVFRLPLIFYSLRQKSEIIATLSPAEMIIGLLFKNSTMILIHVVAVIACLLYMQKISVYLFMASIILSGLSGGLFYRVSTWHLAAEKINAQTAGKYYACTSTFLRNLETVKSCGLERSILTTWRNAFLHKISLQDKTHTYAILMETLNKFFEYIAMLTLFMLGSVQVIAGDLSMGHLMAYYALHLFYCSHLAGLFQAFKLIQTGYAAHLRVSHIECHDEDRRFQNNNVIALQETAHGTITCQDLYFYYNPKASATLSDITIEIKPRQQVALVGSTGSGKSTLAKLLCGLFHAASGTIAVNGRDLVDFSSQDLARLFAYVSQDVSLFSGTIYDNLTLWQEGISLCEINSAIQAACLEEIILSRGLSGKVDDMGNNFSGGEKQRLDIARALVQNTPILVLDEATSALDVRTESQLIANLRQLNKTIIYVAHRLSTIEHCDQIIVIEKGCIVESGTHHDLMQNKSYYYHLIQNEQKALSA